MNIKTEFWRKPIPTEDSMDVSRPLDEPQNDEIEDRDDAAYSAWEERDYYNSIPQGYDRGPR